MKNQLIGINSNNNIEIMEGHIVVIEDIDEFSSSTHYIKYYGDNDYPAFDFYPPIDCESNGISHYKATGIINVIGHIDTHTKLREDIDTMWKNIKQTIPKNNLKELWGVFPETEEND